MKSALLLALAALLPACGGGAASTTPDKAGSSSTASKPATTAQQPPATTTPTAAVKPSEPITAQSDGANSADVAELDGEDEPVNEVLKVLDGLPTQDELDAAAAARISEATADAEYEKLKAEIENDLANPKEDG